jgi:hypothetical protein
MSSMTQRVKPIIRSTASAAVLCLMAGLSSVNGQDNSTDPALLAWQQKTFDYAQRMRGYFESGNQQQQTPPTIPQFETDSDPSGRIATLQPSGPTQTSQNAFFSNIGTNERTCFSCHQPQNGWTVSAASIQDRFNLTNALTLYSG